VFGFDHTKVPIETASREITARLRGLTARTLLFLRQIKEIESVFVRDGGLFSYGPDPVDNVRRAASYVDRILLDR
jgi:hypothetical protein